VLKVDSFTTPLKSQMPPDTPRSSLSTLEMGSKLMSRDLLDCILEFLRCPWRPGSSRRRSVDVRFEAVSGVDEEGGHSSRSLGASKLLRKVPSTRSHTLQTLRPSRPPITSYRSSMEAN
jgi:hypothetical protein